MHAYRLKFHFSTVICNGINRRVSFLFIYLFIYLFILTDCTLFKKSTENKSYFK